jgi:hypothetical protein
MKGDFINWNIFTTNLHKGKETNWGPVKRIEKNPIEKKPRPPVLCTI